MAEERRPDKDELFPEPDEACSDVHQYPEAQVLPDDDKEGNQYPEVLPEDKESNQNLEVLPDGGVLYAIRRVDDQESTAPPPDGNQNLEALPNDKVM